LYTTTGNFSINLTVETEGGCIDSTRLANPVRVVKSPDISVVGDGVICANEQLRLSGVFNQTDTSAVKWSWQLPNGNTSQLQVPTPQTYNAGNYVVITKAINSSGCVDSVSTPITIHSLPVITLPDTIIKRVGMAITLPATYSSGVTSYLWTPATSLSCTTCPRPVATTKFSTNYLVSVIDSNSCSDSASIRVIVLCEGATIFFPNAFSPNGDGSNDVFYPRGNGLDRVKSIRLFNRWGEVVYERKDFPVNNAAYGWDGKYNGKVPQGGIYIYQAEIFCENGEVIRIEGNVALIQ
jgi:gliding motility-associated-like protein